VLSSVMLDPRAGASQTRFFHSSRSVHAKCRLSELSRSIDQ